MVSLFTDGDLFKLRDSNLIAQQIDRSLSVAPSVRKVVSDIPDHLPFKITSANSTCLERAIGAGWLACGDCAQTYDPLSSQGITYALKTGLEAGQYLKEYLTGATNALHYYEYSRLKLTANT